MPSNLTVWETRAINSWRSVLLTRGTHVAWLIVLLAFPFFFFGGPDASSTKLYGALWDCGHIVFFIALVFALSKKIEIGKWQYSALTLLGVFVGGGLIEVIQAHTGRDGNWGDLLRNLSGTCVGLFWLRPPSMSIWLGRIVALAFLVPTLSVVFFEAWFQQQAMRKFPLIAGFESSIKLYGQKSTLDLSPKFRTQGHYSVKFTLNTDPYSGISFRLFNDWTGYKQLHVDIYNPDPVPLTITLRVNDRAHEKTGWVDEDRFNKTFQLNSGWNRLAVPLDTIQKAPATRLMDLSQISLIVLYAKSLLAPRAIYVDNMRLE